MAVTMTLTDGTTTYNLLTGTLKLRYQGWEMQSPMPEGETKLQGYGASFEFAGYNTVTETYQLFAAGAATELLIRQAVGAIDTLLEQARRWHNSVDAHGSPVWLTMTTSAEGTRRSLVYGGAITMLSFGGAQPSLSNNNAAAILTIVRHPLWEDGTATACLAATDIVTYGGQTTALTLSGTAPGRVTWIRFAPYSVAGDRTPLTKLWCGLLTVGPVTRTNFNPRWPCTSGTILTTPVNPMAASVADADGIGANVIQTRFTASGHADLHAFMYIKLSQIEATASRWPQWRGKYRVLCRCKVGAATTVGLQLAAGASDDAYTQKNTEVVATNTAYQWIDLGETTIPLQQYMLSTAYADHKLYLFAERLAGAGELSVDYLVLMPSEHMVYMDNTYVARSGATNYYSEIRTMENDTPYAYSSTDAGLVFSIPAAAFRDFYFPVSTGALAVVVAERAAGHIETDQINMTISVTQRWLHYRNV